MKKIIFTILATALSLGAYAQCKPDSVTYTKAGIYPSKLPDANAYKAYSSEIQFKLPKDTAAGPISGHIDSARIDSVILQVGKKFTRLNKNSVLNYVCSNNNCTYKGGKNGCITLTGTPTNNEAGDDSLAVYLTATITTQIAGTFDVPYSGKVALKINSGTGIFNAPAPASFTVSQNFPNPFSKTTEISFTPSGNNMNHTALFEVTNEIGQVVYSKNINVNQGANTISFQRNGLPSGIYLYSIRSGNDAVTRRMVIND